jgi:putative membrane protein
MTAGALIAAGLTVLALAWGGPLPGLVPASFAAHMTLHMIVVGIGAPLVAVGVAMRFAPTLRPAPAFAAVLSVLDLAIVWGWHAPALHDVARGGNAGLWLEQGTFALVTFGLWLTAFAGPAIVGALALFMTSMHMTLLGALLGLAPRTVYPGHDHVEHPLGLSAIADQQLGGAAMLGVGGVVYLVAGLWLMSRVLKRPAPR